MFRINTLYGGAGNGLPKLLPASSFSAFLLPLLMANLMASPTVTTMRTTMRPVFRKSILLFLMRLDAEGSMMSRLPAFIVEEEGEESENVLVIMFCFTAASGTKVACFPHLSLAG